MIDSRITTDQLAIMLVQHIVTIVNLIRTWMVNLMSLNFETQRFSDLYRKRI